MSDSLQKNNKSEHKNIISTKKNLKEEELKKPIATEALVKAIRSVMKSDGE